MYLTDVASHPAPGPHAAVIAQMTQAGLEVPEIQYLFAFKPAHTAHLARYTQCVMRGPSPLSPGQRELIAALTSAINRCKF